jgi:hypothetical protein
LSKTYQLTINALATTPIVIQSNPGCKRVSVVENSQISGWPTAKLLIYKPDPVSSTPITIPQGESYSVDAGVSIYPTGSSPFSVRVLTGSTTLDVDEDGN